jgi:transcriptional regulator with XRE-family HTH domain
LASTKNIKQQFANRVKTLRAQKEMTASALAKSAEVSPASVWQWEHAGAVPRKPTLDKLATLFDVSPDFLLTGDETPKAVSDAPPTSLSISLEAVPLEDLIKAIQVRGFRIRVETI